VSGMIIGTMFTLFVVPSIYMLLARRRTSVVAEAEDATTERHSALRPSPISQPALREGNQA
jgi:hypothetical protein